MFAIANDRKSLWQWDLNQQLTVAGDCTEVHYLDRGAPSTMTLAVKDGKADIPNILLQKAGRLVVYAYIIDEQDHHTKVCETFGIAPRPKPAEYVYTETEVKTWNDLQAQIGDLTDLATDEKDNLVAAINEAAQSGGGGGTKNAVLYIEQDLNDEQKTQARKNIGAGTSSFSGSYNDLNDKPSAYTLPQATANVLGGVKADPATASDTQPVRISEDGKLVTAVGAGGKNSKVESWNGMELLASGTITSGTAAGTKTDAGVTYGAFKQWHRVIFIRRCASGQGNFCFGYGYENNLGFRNSDANMSVVYEHIDGYLWKYHCHATDTAAYAAPLTAINSYTKTLWAPSFGSTNNCNIDDGYIDIRCGIQDEVANGEQLTFGDENTFKIKNWAALTADVSWYIYGLTKEVAQ